MNCFNYIFNLDSIELTEYRYETDWGDNKFKKLIINKGSKVEFTKY